MENNNLFSKEELREKVFALNDGKKPYADFTSTYVDELLDEMFPQHKSIEIGVDRVNAREFFSGRTGYFVLEEYEL